MTDPRSGANDDKKPADTSAALSGAAKPKSTVKAGEAPATATPIGSSPATVKEAYEAARNSTQRLFTTIALHSEPLATKNLNVQSVRVQQLQRHLRGYDGKEQSALFSGFKAMQSKLLAALPPEVDKDEVERKLAFLNEAIHKMHMDLLSNAPFDQQAWDQSFQTAQTEVDAVLDNTKPSDPAKKTEFDKKIKAAKDGYAEELRKLQTDTAVAHFNDTKTKHEAARATARSELGDIGNNNKRTWNRIWDLGSPKDEPKDLTMTTTTPMEDGIYRKPGSMIEVHVKDGKAWPNVLNLDEQWALMHPKVGWMSKPTALLATIASVLPPAGFFTPPGTFRSLIDYVFNKPSPEELSRMVEDEMMSFRKEHAGHHTLIIDSSTHDHGSGTHWRKVDLNDIKKRMENAKKHGFKVIIRGNELAAINYASDAKREEMRGLLREVNDYHEKLKREAEAIAAKGLPNEVLDAERRTQVTKNSATNHIDKLKGQPKLEGASDEAKVAKGKENILQDAKPLQVKAKIDTEITSIETRLKDLKAASEFLNEKIKALDTDAEKNPQRVLDQKERLQALLSQIETEGKDLFHRIDAVRGILTDDSRVNQHSENLQGTDGREIRDTDGNVISMSAQITKIRELETNMNKLGEAAPKQENLDAVMKKAEEAQAKKEAEEQPAAVKPSAPPAPSK